MILKNLTSISSPSISVSKITEIREINEMKTPSSPLSPSSRVWSSNGDANSKQHNQRSSSEASNSGLSLSPVCIGLYIKASEGTPVTLKILDSPQWARKFSQCLRDIVRGRTELFPESFGVLQSCGNALESKWKVPNSVQKHNKYLGKTQVTRILVPNDFQMFFWKRKAGENQCKA